MNGSGKALGVIGLVRVEDICVFIWDGEVFTDFSILILFGCEDKI